MLACFRRRSLLLASLVVLAIGFAEEAGAQSDLPLPPGEVINGPIFRRDGTFVPEIEVGADANTYLNIGPPTEPFTPSADAVVVRTSVQTQYVRAYTNGVTSPIGSFLAGSNSIRGLNAEQIRNVLALPYLPDSLTIVQVPAETCMIVGEAAPIVGHFPANPPSIPTAGPWGQGGVPQERLIGISSQPRCANPQFIPLTSYIDLQLIGDAALAYRPRAGSGNTLAVAKALDAGPDPELFTDMDSIYNSLDLINVGGGATLRRALTALGGEPYANVPTVEIESARMFLDAVHDEVRLDRAAANPRDVPVRQWLTGFGGTGGLDASGDLQGMHYDIAGVAGGMDRWFAPSFLAGFAVGYARSNFDANLISGSVNANTVSGAIYVTYAPGRWYVDGTAGYAHSEGTLDRSIVFPGLVRHTKGEPAADAFLSNVETGYAFPLGRSTTLTPLVALQGIVVSEDGFAENGAGAIDLNVHGNSSEAAIGLFGGELTQEFGVGLPAPLLVKLRAGWTHDFADTSRSFTAGFVGLPGPSFAISGVNAPDDAAIINVLASLTLKHSLDVYLRYDAAFVSGSDGTSVQGGSAGLRFVF
ncbi:MAG: autotransporter domain-containing protein [Actinomycetota bacterium]